MVISFTLATFLFLIPFSNNIVNGNFVPTNGCEIFQGDWIYDDESSPLYDTVMCPFIEPIFDCRRNGRPDKDYLKYKWQPTGCDLPRFNGVDFLKKLTGKRLMFVGDSLSLNQWQSLTCMLHVAVPQAQYIAERLGALSNFTFPAYNVSIMFLRNAFLVDITSEPRGRVLMLDSISTSEIWGGMDVMIFDSWHWWFHNGTKQPWDLVVYGNTAVEDMDRMSTYEIALNTWAKWIDSNVDSTKSKVFFQGVSPDHASGLLGSNAETCVGQTEPLKNSGNLHPAELVLENVLREMNESVHLLNITKLSQLRIDGHPSIYGHGGSRDLDCTHWCLPGIPDIWNHFLYAAL